MGEDDKNNIVGPEPNKEATQNNSSVEPIPTTAESTTTLPVQPLTTPQTPKSKKRKFIFIGIIIAGIALLAGVGGAAYYAYYLPNTPENVVRQALANTLDQEEFKSSVKFTGELSVESKEGVKANVNFDVSKDKTTGLALNVKSYGVTADLVTQDGKTVYVKIGGLNGLDKLLEQYDNSLPIGQYEDLIKGLGPLLTKLNNQWYQIDSSLLGPTVGLQQSLGSDLGLSEQDTDKIVDIYVDNEFVVVDKKGATVDINGKSATEYQLHIDGPKLKTFVADLKNANIEGVEISDEDVSQINQFVDKNDLSKYPFNVWINQDKNIVRFAYSHQYESAKIELKLTISDVGADIKIEAPKGSKSIFELLTDVQPLLDNIDGFAPTEDSIQELENSDSI